MLQALRLFVGLPPLEPEDLDEEPLGKAMAADDAMAEIERCSGTQFDPECARALLEVVSAQGWPRVARDRVVRLPHDSG
jgi:HD-GYP domain-containing protein (c-di-GMP phosphodiesterase class II)